MSKLVVVVMMSLVIAFFANCHGPKKAMVQPPPKSTYMNNMSVLVAANCSPCHFPAKGGRKKPLDTYAAVVANIDDVLRRIELNPTDRGFMPDKRAKLNDSTLAAFRSWKTDGMLEK